jgi:hypothetical protein
MAAAAAQAADAVETSRKEEEIETARLLLEALADRRAAENRIAALQTELRASIRVSAHSLSGSNSDRTYG